MRSLKILVCVGIVGLFMSFGESTAEAGCRRPLLRAATAPARVVARAGIGVGRGAAVLARGTARGVRGTARALNAVRPRVLFSRRRGC